MDTVYAYKFILLMQKAFSEWTAFKVGIIDDKGNVLKRPKSPEEKLAYTDFHASVRSMKRMMSTIPGLSTMNAMASAYGVTARRFGITEAEIIKETQIIIESMPEFAFLLEAEVAGDAGGDPDKIAKGETSGAIISKGPSTLKKKKLEEGTMGRALKKAVKKVRRKIRPTKS